MIVRRFWLDGDGGSHVEEVTLIAGEPSVYLPGGPVEIEGLPLTGPGRVVAVVDPMCGVGALGEGLSGVWSADPLEGARVVDRSEWETVLADQEAARVQQLAVLRGEA